MIGGLIANDKPDAGLIALSAGKTIDSDNPIAGRTITIEVNADGEALYDVQEIRKMRLTVDGDAEFLVKWVSGLSNGWGDKM